MPKKLHPLVLKTKFELEKLDEDNVKTWGERHSYKGSNLSISVEPKLRPRALSFMNDLLLLLEVNGHSLKLDCNRLQIEMYGQLTEFNLRQKYYRIREKVDSDYSKNIFVKSYDLEFQVGYSYRKGWIDKKNKKIEEQLPSIYNYIEARSKEWAEIRKRQKNQEEEKELKRKVEQDKARLIAIENDKTDTLIQNASNYQKAGEIRVYLQALEGKLHLSQVKDENLQEYINWGYDKANKLDPLFDKD